MEKLLVCSCAANDPYSLSSAYLLDNELDTVKAGVKKYADMIGASDIMYFLVEGSKSYGLEKEAFGQASPVMDNPYAIVQQLKGNLPRPMIQDDYVAEYEGKAVYVLTPEVAYNLAAPEKKKFVTINKGDKAEVKAVPYGTKLSEVVDAAGAKAILLGGLKGQFILPAKLGEYTTGDDILSGSVTIYGPEACMVVTTADLMNKTWMNSCNKCVLCRDGTYQVKSIMDDMPVGKSKAGDIDLLKDIAPLIKIGSYCPYGQNWPNTLLSALELFADEFDAHIKKKSCPAGVCFQAGATYIILPDKCTGCGDCVDACDYTAIEGKKKFIHMIDQQMCEHCGECVDSCDEEAIVKWEGKLPKLPKKLTKVGKF
ncbi:MAG: 4Fe-4S binding protein [Parasporobacterium sp.]|nr:4Fe-4S binding protein [Parasporobacterium sp.]